MLNTYIIIFTLAILPTYQTFAMSVPVQRNGSPPSVMFLRNKCPVNPILQAGFFFYLHGAAPHFWLIFEVTCSYMEPNKTKKMCVYHNNDERFDIGILN